MTDTLSDQAAQLVETLHTKNAKGDYVENPHAVFSNVTNDTLKEIIAHEKSQIPEGFSAAHVGYARSHAIIDAAQKKLNTPEIHLDTSDGVTTTRTGSAQSAAR